MKKDYSKILRKDVNFEDTWKTEDIFLNKEKWNNHKNELFEKIEKISLLKDTWLNSAHNFYNMLEFIHDISKETLKIYLYSSLLYDTDMEDLEAQEMKGESENLFVRFRTKTSFIESDILSLSKEQINNFFNKEKKLKNYDIYIQKIIDKKEHILSEEKETLISLTGLFSDNTRKAYSVLNNLDLPLPRVTLKDNTIITLSTANFNLYRGSKIRKDRETVMKAFFENRYKFRNTFAALLDGGIKTHLFNARSRGYTNCLEAALKPNDIDRNVYLNLINTVKANLKPLHNYLKIKKDLLGIEKMRYSDIYASSISSIDKTYSINEGIKLVINSMSILGSEYTDALKTGFKNRWMDKYPNKGKRSGAYSNGVFYDGHPYVLMNYDGRYGSVSTLAHEFGHALHSHFSNQNNHYSKSRYPIFLAEIASTFNESALIEHILKTEKSNEFKKYIIDQYLDKLRGTLYRQTLFAEFELLIHKEVEDGRSLTADFLDTTYLRLTREYYGHDQNITEVPEYIKSEWSCIPHFYMNYYVYQYSTGVIASMALIENVLSGEKNSKEKYKTFLKSGGSDYPLNILKTAGVDMTKIETIQKGIDRFKNLVEKFNSL